MILINARDPKTLEPSAVMILTNRDIRAMREQVKASIDKQIVVKMPEVTALLIQLDEIMKENLGEEKWKEAIQSGMLPVKTEQNEQTNTDSP